MASVHVLSVRFPLAIGVIDLSEGVGSFVGRLNYLILKFFRLVIAHILFD